MQGTAKTVNFFKSEKIEMKKSCAKQDKVEGTTLSASGNESNTSLNKNYS